MAQGDESDQLDRLNRLIPGGWRGDEAPLWEAILAAIASIKAWLFGAITFVAAQTRIATASGGWIDAIAADFLGDMLPRRIGESDTSYRARVSANLFRSRATRPAMEQALLDLTGQAPAIFEPHRVADTGAYGGPFIGYGLAGAYGALSMPFQAFVTVTRSITFGVPGRAGYNVSSGGYGSSTIAYTSLDQAQLGVTDADIYDTINRVRPAATIIWTRIVNASGAAAPPQGSLVFADSRGTLLINGIQLRIADQPIALV